MPLVIRFVPFGSRFYDVRTETTDYSRYFANAASPPKAHQTAKASHS